MSWIWPPADIPINPDVVGLSANWYTNKPGCLGSGHHLFIYWRNLNLMIFYSPMKSTCMSTSFHKKGRQFNPTTFYWSVCTKPGRWAVMISGHVFWGYFASFYDILFWDCYDNVREQCEGTMWGDNVRGIFVLCFILY